MLSKIATSRRYHLYIFGCAALLLASAFFWGPSGVDFDAHSLWVRFFAAQFWNGDLYPRWLMDSYAGNGSPVFFYYPPLAYFITAFFHFLAPLDPLGHYQIALSAWLAVMASGYGFYAWMRYEAIAPNAAIAASLLYMAAPTNASQNFYHFMLFSSVWAYAWFPLLMLATRRLQDNKPYGVAGFAGALSLMILTNIPTVVVVSVCVAAMVLSQLTAANWRGTLLKFSLATGLAIGLCAAYMLPSLAYYHMVVLDAFGHSAHWARRSDAAYYWLWWIISLVMAFYYYPYCDKKYRPKMINGIIVVSLLLMLPQIAPLWQSAPLLIFIQFPERIFIVSSLFLAWFAAATWAKTKRFSIAVLITYLLVALATAYTSHQDRLALYTEKPLRAAMQALNIDMHADYLPDEHLAKLFRTPMGIDWIKTHNAKTEVLRGDADVRITRWEPRHIALSYDAKSNTSLSVRQFYFAGWVAVSADKEIKIEKHPYTGQILLQIPEGSGEITITLERLMPEIAGLLISMVFASILALMVLLEIRRRQPSV